MLLFIDDSEPKVDFIGLVKCRVHSHDLTECLLGVFETTVPIIENADSVPEFRLLLVWRKGSEGCGK